MSGDLGVKSVVPSIWVQCVQSKFEAMFPLETDESYESYETLGHGRSRGTIFIHLGFVVAEI